MLGQTILDNSDCMHKHKIKRLGETGDCTIWTSTLWWYIRSGPNLSNTLTSLGVGDTCRVPIKGAWPIIALTKLCTVRYIIIIISISIIFLDNVGKIGRWGGSIRSSTCKMIDWRVSNQKNKSVKTTPCKLKVA